MTKAAATVRQFMRDYSVEFSENALAQPRAMRRVILLPECMHGVDMEDLMLIVEEALHDGTANMIDCTKCRTRLV